jgi:hypothetical protein
MSFRRSVLTRMASQQSRLPQFVRIPSSFALQQASDTGHALASAVIVGSLPDRGRSSSAAIGP